MDAKDQLVKVIRDWVKVDNEIRTLQRELSDKRAHKKDISKILISTMKDNSIDCFNLNDGQLSYLNKNIKKPITKKALIQILSTYFQGNSEKATEINDYIMENREEIVKETIVRKINK
jgi:hypothetical protein